MIDKLRSIAIFATVIEQGTFRAAALHLGLAPSRISETVSELEKSLGVTLLYRSTRSLSLTQEGRLLYEKAQEMLVAAELGLDAINPQSSDPQGELRVTAPAFITQTEMMDRFADFCAAYPRIFLSLDFSDRQRDVIKDNYDIAIRAGWLEDSQLMNRKVGIADRLLVASPAYVERMGLPEHPKDLEDWEWIRFSMRPNQTDLTDKDGETVTVLGRSKILVNTADALFEFATRGLGVTAIPENLACRGLGRGELFHVLPEWTLKPLGLHAVWPDQSRRNNLTMTFVRFLAHHSPDQ
ncbi:MAG: LysR family transcriptional regulator [Yoonia sp.]|uniref:LysR family transcriptional regulator n=1 Tax=Yoonia sp. TaxID=2212373 RepID=UPI00326677C9